MKKYILLTLVCFGLVLSVAGSAWQPTTNAQSGPITTSPVEFHRFIVSNNNLGIFLTTNLSEGQGNPYNYAYFPFPAPGAQIVVTPASGYTPRGGQGLLALHRYQVVESGRVYYHYTIYPGGQGSNYYYQGQVGYVLPNDGSFGGQPLHFWYSQQYGYYYTLNNEYPPCCSFTYHGVQYYLPQGGSYIFDPPPTCTDCGGGCNVPFSVISACVRGGGTWNSVDCYCEEGGGCGGGGICQ